MRPRRGRGDGHSLMQVAAAVVGSAAASQVIAPEPVRRPELKCSPETLVRVREAIMRLGEGRIEYRWVHEALRPMHIGWVNDALEYLVQTGELRRFGSTYQVAGCCLYHDPDAEAVQCCGDCPTASAPAPAGDPAGHGFPTPSEPDVRSAVAAMDVHAALNSYETPGTPEGAYEVDVATMAVVGANGRRLIVRWQDEGVWIGGCLITDPAVAETLAVFVAREADE